MSELYGVRKIYIVARLDDGEGGGEAGFDEGSLAWFSINPPSTVRLGRKTEGVCSIQLP